MSAMGNSSASGELRSFVERLVRTEERKREIAADAKEIKAEAKARGFDVKALSVLVKRAMETASETNARREHEAITELYLASLGMLDGTPLGDSARKRLMEPPAPPAPAAGADSANSAEGAFDPEPEGEGGAPRGAMTAEEIEAARDAGGAAARDGKKVIENPYVAGDPRRAAWDEGWCAATGSDGMDIPDAWKRRRPKKADETREGASE